MTLTVKPLTAAHAGEWQAMRITGARDFPMGFLVTEDEMRAVTLEQAATKLSQGGVRGIFKEDVLIGYSGYHRQGLEQTRHRAEIGPFFIAPAFHGTGAAQALMSALLDEARADGVDFAELYVDSRNMRAIAFYERLGFVRLATIPDIVRVNGQRCDDHFYRLDLNA